jgi:crossover junction endodeoxyribonuclease RusA
MSTDLSGITQHLTLPLPPSINMYWRKSPRGMYITDAGKLFRQQVIAYVGERTMTRFGTHKVIVSMVVHMRDKRRADVDNRIKAALDALVHAGLFDDDSQVDELHLYRGEIVKGGLCTVIVTGA